MKTLILGLLLLTPTARAQSDREVIINLFRTPSTGVEFREGFFGVHVGVYPGIVDNGPDGSSRTTRFLKFGVSAYPLGFDTGSGRKSSPYAALSLVQGLNNDWDVSKSVTHGAGVSLELGFRWAAWRGLDIRLGASALLGFDGRLRFAPTPGIGWAIPY